MTTDAILAEVAGARREIDRTVRIDWPAERWLAALGERFGAVCQAVVRGGHDADLRAVLVEVAAVCGAWWDAQGARWALPRERRFAETVAQYTHPLLEGHELASMVSRFGRANSGAPYDIAMLAATAVAWAASLDRVEEGR